MYLPVALLACACSGYWTSKKQYGYAVWAGLNAIGCFLFAVAR